MDGAAGQAVCAHAGASGRGDRDLGAASGIRTRTKHLRTGFNLQVVADAHGLLITVRGPLPGVRLSGSDPGTICVRD
jgi:hypothetical protein